MIANNAFPHHPFKGQLKVFDNNEKLRKNGAEMSSSLGE